MDGDLPLGLPVHPLAALFPMLPDDELADLADDIKVNGLIHPIMLDQAGDMLVDGRNRLAACDMAGVEPHFERLPDGVEPADYIVSANLQRRNLTKGQAAMALAMIYPDPEKGGRGKKLSSDVTVSRQRLSLARAVLRMAPDDLAPAVLSGSKTLDVAFADARRRQEEATSDEAKLARLHGEASDIADLIIEGTLSLAEAYAAFERREQDAAAAEKNKRETLLRLTEAACRGLAAWGSTEFAAAVFDRLDDDEFRQQLIERLRIEEPIDVQGASRAIKKMLGKIAQ